MANPFNDAFSSLLSVAKNGLKNGNGNGNSNGLKINNPTINKINSLDWRFDGDDLVIDTPEKKAYYQMLVGAGGSVSKKQNLFANEIDLFKNKDSIRNVVVDGKKAYGKLKVGKAKLSKLTQVGFNEREAFDASIQRGKDWRSMPHELGSPAEKEVVAAMKELGIYTHTDFIEFAQWNKRGVEDTLAAIPKGYSAGHGKSASSGGPMTARNLWNEEAGINYSRQNKSDAPDEVLDAIGVPRTWKIVVGRWAFDTGRIVDPKYAPTEAEKLMLDEDIIESLASLDWKTVLQKRKTLNNKLQQPNT